MQRKEAKALGLTTYDGKPCLHGHGGKRFVSTCNCTECNKLGGRKNVEYARAYYKVYRQRWQEKDPTGYREYWNAKAKRYRERHPEKIAKAKAHAHAIKMTTLRLLYYT